MSVKAISWAFEQHPGSPGAKLVLIALANHASDGDWTCFVKRSTLAEYSDQSKDTVSRRLRELEEAGYIAREERYLPHGGRGADLYRLLHGRPADIVQENDDPPSADCGEGASADCGGVLPPDAEAPSATVQRHNKPPLNRLLNNPHSPPAGGEASGATSNREGEADGTQLDTIISELKAADPDIIIDRPAARRQWARLDTSERAKALAGVSRYVDRWRSAGQRYKLRGPSGYLKGQLWRDMALAPPDKPVERPPMDARSRAVAWARSDASREGWVFVDAGSDAWAAWDQAFRDEGRRLPPATPTMAPAPGGGFAKRPGRSFPMERPPPRGMPAMDADAAE